MKGCVQLNPVIFGKNSTYKRIKTLAASSRAALNPLSHLGSGRKRKSIEESCTFEFQIISMLKSLICLSCILFFFYISGFSCT